MSQKTIILSIIIIIIALAGWYFYSASNAKKPIESAVAKRGTLIQEVSVSGRIKPAESISLSFEKSGRIKSASAKIGDKVFPSQVLAQIDNAELLSQIDQAEAGLKIQQIKLEEMLKGTRSEEIAVYDAKVKSAQISLTEAKNSLADAIQNIYTNSDDAVRNKTDQFFTNPRTNSPQIIFVTIDSQLKINIEEGRKNVENTFGTWKLSLDKLTNAQNISSNANEAEQNIKHIKSFLENIALAVNSLQVSANLSQTTIDAYKTAVSTARTNINTAISALTTAEEKYSGAETALSVAEKELALKKSGATKEQIDGQKAQIESSEAGLENYKAQLEKMSLRSPIYGTVTKQDAKVGELASANSSLITINSDSAFKIEANIPEADIAKIKIGNSAKVTLDAYGDSVIFEASVTSIDPAEIIIDGVPTYKTTLHFKSRDERVKSGMTANIDILTDKKDDVVYIPQRAVIGKNGGKKVRILLDEKTGKIEEVDIKTGIRDSSGNIEVTEGLKEGDRVVVSQ